MILYDSARFGIVNAIATRQGKAIPKGDELFLHYGYSYSAGPRWYKKVFRDFIFARETSDTGRGCRVNDDMICDPVALNKDEEIINRLFLKHNLIYDKSTVSDNILDVLLSEHNLLTSRTASQQTIIKSP